MYTYLKESVETAAELQARVEAALDAKPPDIDVIRALADEAMHGLMTAHGDVVGTYQALFTDLDHVLITHST